MGQVQAEQTGAVPLSVSLPKAIGHLTVIAGLPAVGKSRLIRVLREDDTLRERMAVPKDTPVHTATELLELHWSGTIDHLVLHYDILRPFIKRFPSYELDPGTAALRSAEKITFFTLRTTPERLRAQLESRLASRPRKRLRKLRPFYADDRFLADWCDRWLTFVQLYRDVTVGHYLVDVHTDYVLTPVEDDVPAPGMLPGTALHTNDRPA